MSEDAARREVRRAVEAKGGRGRFAEQIGIDVGTLGDFLDGKRWPHARTRARIEDGLGWDSGRIMDLKDGALVDQPHAAVVDAIINDPELLPEAKEHLVRQYGLLLRVQAAPAQPAVERADKLAQQALEREDELRKRRKRKPPTEGP